MKPLVDQQARDHIREALGTTLVVEAAAGTGKTSELVRRVMALLCQGNTTLARLVAVTFTEKAAGEMKLRLRTEIERARGEVTPAERARLDVALEELEEAHIGTIHGFCAELLRQRPVEARVDPLFVAADEDQQARVFEEAFERWFQEVLGDPPEGVRRVLRRRARGRQIPGSSSSWTNQGSSGAREVLRRAGLALIQQRDFDAPWRRDPFDRDPTLDALVARLQELGNLAGLAMDPDDWAAKSLKEVERWVSELVRREAVRGRDHDGLEEELRTLARGKFWGWKGRGKWFAQGKSRQDVLDQRLATKQELDRVIERADADLAACLHRDLLPLVAAYDAQKTRAGRLDFLDLLLLARNLVKDDPAVRRELQERFTHLLVDEFQDTDPLQAEILMLLAADDPAQNDWLVARPIPGKLFVVGDPKQSIYRFRRADVTLYEATKRRLIAHGAVLVHLTTSFRSTPSLQAAVNAAFAPRMQGSQDGSQAEYVPLQSFRDEPTDRPSVVALPVPEPYSDFGKITGYSIDASLPDAVGAFVDWLIRKSGWTVTERERPRERVPIEARHVCLLTRRFVNAGRDLTRDYVRALEARRIAHVLVGGRSFHAREEVVALRNALAAIEWPDDELSVFATLRGPFFALGDDALLAFRHQTGAAPHPLRKVDLSSRMFAAGVSEIDGVVRPVLESLAILRRLHLGRNRRATADTVAQLLDETRAHAGVAIWPTGEQALANLLRVVDQARRFEAAGATSFRAFVQWLDAESERGNAAEAPVVEEGTDGVRIMTVYKAKGLEFPVVILVDPTCPHTFQEPSRYVDGKKRLWAMPLAGCTPIELIEHRDEVLRHDDDEAVRLTYVAATRARELLVVPVVGDEPFAGWVDVLHPALYPRPIDWRRSEPAPGCPQFGNDSVLVRPDGRDPEGSVTPGLHAPTLGTHKVVFWDPRALELGKEEEAGLRQQRILAADETGVVAEEGTRAHAEWQARRESLLARGSIPMFRIETVTQDGPAGSAAGAGPAIAVTVEESDASSSRRPGGKRFGTLVHAVLGSIALDAGLAPVKAAAATYGQMLGATSEEIAAAADAVSGALRHPVMQAARAAGEACRREAPVLLEREDGALVEGALDLAYRTSEAGGPVWVIVDYKTDAELSGHRATYEEQVRTYARAVARATGETTRGVLLRV